MQHITTILKEVGLTDKEVKVYVSLFEHKKLPVSTIAKRTGITRTSTYDVLNALHRKGLILRYSENKKTVYTIDTPKRLMQWLKTKAQHVQAQQDTLGVHLSEIESYFRSSGLLPRVRYFEGDEQIEEFYNDSLETKSNEIIGYSTSEVVSTAFTKAYQKKYARVRCKKNIGGRYIVLPTDVQAIQQYMASIYRPYLKNKPGLVVCRVLEVVRQPAVVKETIVYDNKIAVADFANGFYGVIIESKDIADTQKTIFNSLWALAQQEIK